MAKENLGKDLIKSIEIMDSLLEALKKFRDTPLKRGLASSDIDDKDMSKQVNEVFVEVSSLINKIEDLKHLVKGIKPKSNSRFAHRIVGRFLKDSNNLLIQ